MTTQSDIELQDVLDTKSLQLSAMLQNTYGGSGESFRDMSNELQDAYMWACADMANEIVKTLGELSERLGASRNKSSLSAAA